MGALKPRFTSAFQRDLRKKARRRGWDLTHLEEVIDLVRENTPESRRDLKRRHQMHRLQGQWSGHLECHVANVGDWLVIWYERDGEAVFARTGTHDELF